jgi:N-methylhydantoinase A/oxoprolinase/acetone carboxylase beta subunit
MFSERDGVVSTPVYEMSRLAPANAFEGPALIESDDTTVVVSPGWACLVDQRLGIVLTHAEEPAHV